MQLDHYLLAHEVTVRIVSAFAVLVAMALWELAAPRRRIEIPRLLRWSNNIAIVVLDSIAVRVLFPIMAVGLALLAAERGWGLFHLFAPPVWMAIALSILLLDCAIYWQHVLFHAVPALWRLHRMHHADQEFDATTGLRFHPLEIVISTLLKLAVVVALGPPAVAVLIFEILLNATALFNHSNVCVPAAVDKILRWIVVTPDMHRVHHSIRSVEMNSNYGFNLPWWDRVFHTYHAQPNEGHEGMTIGLERFRTRRDLWLDRLLTQPWR